jgi:hypothetical protein
VLFDHALLLLTNGLLAGGELQHVRRWIVFDFGGIVIVERLIGCFPTVETGEHTALLELAGAIAG